MGEPINDKVLDYTHEILGNITDLKNGSEDIDSLNKKLLLSLFKISKSKPQFLSSSQFQDLYLPLRKLSFDVENKFFFDNKKHKINNNTLNTSIPPQPEITITEDSSLNVSNNQSLIKANLLNDISLSDFQIDYYQNPFQDLVITEEKNVDENLFSEQNFDVLFRENDGNNKYSISLTDEKKEKEKNKEITKNSSLSFFSTTDEIKNTQKNFTKSLFKINISHPGANEPKFFLKQKTLDYYFGGLGANYINIMLEHFNNLQELSENPIDSSINKTIFIKSFKSLLFDLGICNKQTYQEILRTIVFVRHAISFDDFLQSFKYIFNLPLNQSIVKYRFLLFIIQLDKAKEYFIFDNIKIYFNFLRSSLIYDQELTEEIIDNLLSRYSVIYFNEEQDNIIMGKYSIKKLATTLETFFTNYIE